MLASHRPEGTPDHVAIDSGPVRLLDQIRAANNGGDVHLIGGPTTIETYRSLAVLARLELVVVPLLFGGSVEIVYAAAGSRTELPARPASQH